MIKRRQPRTHTLDLRCDCAEFGTPMTLTAAWTTSLFRCEGADYICINCRRIERATDVPTLLFGKRIVFECLREGVADHGMAIRRSTAPTIRSKAAAARALS